MCCALSWEVLGAYLDQEPDYVSSAEVSDHLTACPSCAEIVAQICEQGALIRSLGTYRAPHQLRKAIARGMLETPAKPDAHSGEQPNGTQKSR
jgi:predicted anti-sigma-YlaC factor YlaD